MTTTDDIVYIKASCHCGSNVFRIAFKRTNLPIESDLCHCNACRHQTGRLGVYFARIDGAPYRFDGSLGEGEGTKGEDVPASLVNLVEYRTSPVGSRWSCTTCGAQVLWKYDSTWLLDDVTNPSNQEVATRFGINLKAQGDDGPGMYWAIAAGLLERVEGVVRVGYHMFVGETLDGGLADHFRGVPGEDLKRWAEWPAKSELLERGWRSPNLPTSPDGDKLRFYCHCRAVDLYITRPLPRDKPPTKEEWYVHPDGKHFPAGHCGCESCRLTSGFEVSSWAFVPMDNIHDGKTGELVDFRAERHASMTIYKSSVGRRRYFCSTCGAAVFWYGDERPTMMDVAVGLVDESQDGVRAESWFEWFKDHVNGAAEMLSSHSRQSIEYGTAS